MSRWVATTSRTAVVTMALLVVLGASAVVVGVIPSSSIASTAPARPAPVGPIPAAVGPSSSTPYWTNLSIPSSESPPPAGDSDFVWDSTDGYGLLFGGYYENATLSRDVFFNDTWTYLSGVWTNVTPPHSPSERWGSVMADDPYDHEVILFGGAETVYTPSVHTVYLNDTWAWRAGSWTNITPTVSPPEGYWGSMTYDAATQSVILLDGDNHTDTGLHTYGNDSWSFQGGKWTQLFPATLPPARDDQQMVYDAASQEIVMFGGTSLAGYDNDTWTYSGYPADWTEVSSATHPGARNAAGMDYDAPVGAVALYGGTPAPDDYYATWLFSGGAWTEYTLSPVPPNPTNPWNQMIFDPVDNYTVLFYLPDLIGYDTQTWTLTIPATSVPPTLHVILSASPNPITLGNSTTITAAASGGTGPYTYSYSTLPTGCASMDLASIPCTPAASGDYVIGVNVTDSASGHGSGTTTLVVTSTTPSPISVTLGDDPSSLTIGASTVITAQATGGTGEYTYVYSTLPPGCSSTDAARFTCTPTQVGNYVIGVNVTDTASDHGSAVARLSIQPTAGTPPSSSSTGSGFPSWEWDIVLVVVILAALLAFAFYRRRRRASTTGPAFSPPPPPAPPPPPS
jgi:hypothetical protein